MKVAKCTVNSKSAYRVSYKENGVYRRKFFASQKAANSWANDYSKAESFSRKESLTLSDAQLDDVIAAIKLLPSDRTLLESVKRAWGNMTNASLSEYVDKFNEMKKSTGICDRHYRTLKNRTAAILEHFKEFDAITPQASYEYLSMKGPSRKTLAEWFNTMNDFLRYCVRLDAIKGNPLAKWTLDDFGRKKIKKAP